MALEAEIKRADYGGKITKKRKRLHKIYNKAIKDLSKFDLPTWFIYMLEWTEYENKPRSKQH